MSGKFMPTQAPTTAVHANMDQEVIATTEDKLRLCLHQHLRDIERKKEWIAPLGILIAVATAFASSKFQDWYLKAAVWEALFLLTGAISFVWLIYTAVRALNSPTVDDVVDRIKNKAKPE